MIHEFVCHQCKKQKRHESDLSTGYGLDKNDNKICFDCCGLNDAKYLAELKPQEKFFLYLDTKAKTLTNWPGTFKLQLHYIRQGSHNIAGKRYDTWFDYKGNDYHAVQYGDSTQIAHIRRLKHKIA